MAGTLTLIANEANLNLAYYDTNAIKGCIFVNPKLTGVTVKAYPLPNLAVTTADGDYEIKSDAGKVVTVDYGGTFRGNTSYFYSISSPIAIDAFLSSTNQRAEFVTTPVNLSAGGNINITYDSVTVSPVTNIAINRNDALSDITLTFTKQTTQNTNIKAYQGELLVGTWNTTGTSVLIPKNTLPSGNIKFVIVNQALGLDSVATEATFNLVSILPVILTLEPDSVNQNIDLAINVSWSGTNIDKFKLTIDGNVYTGTTATSLTIPANTLTTGTKTMVLEVTYIPPWATSESDYRKVTKTVTFLAYGKPALPVFDATTIYNTATPTFSWQSLDQVAYQLQLLKVATTIIDSMEVLTTNKSYVVTTALENNTTYTLKLRVKNQYGLWSEYSTKTITTNFTVLPKATLTAYPNTGDGSIIVNYVNNYHVEFSHCEIWRRAQYGEWVRMCSNMPRTGTWVDYYTAAKKQYEYKIRSISTGGGVSESDIATSTTDISGYNFYNVENLSDKLTFVYNAEVIPTYNRNESLTMYAGCNAPSYETDNIIYKVLSMKFATKNMYDIDKLLNLIKTTKVFLYKDSKGNKVFGMITGNFSPETSDLGITTITLAFTELSFIEKDVYDGVNLPKLLYFDGTWKFDGSQTFDGVI